MSMKAKQQTHEKWKARKTKIQPLFIGIAASIVFAGAYFMYRSYLT